eukprot:scaffold7195_cov417-Prasinococcus_capsulatus_cf.AAC.4
MAERLVPYNYQWYVEHHCKGVRIINDRSSVNWEHRQEVYLAKQFEEVLPACFAALRVVVCSCRRYSH